MNLSGNQDLLNRPLVAFFASRNASSDARDATSRWVDEIVQSDKIVISGFHSPIERWALKTLLDRGCSVVVTLGRALYRKVPERFQPAYDEGRILFLSFRDDSRPSFFNSQLRNWATADLANEVVFVPYDKASQLSTLHHSLTTSGAKCRIL